MKRCKKLTSGGRGSLKQFSLKLSIKKKSVPHLIVNQVVENTKRDVFMKKSLVLLKNVSAYLTYIKRMVEGRFTQRFLKIKNKKG